ncbi:MAG: hypothetical protein ACE5F9_10900 [Phycisphaerae bacterium]
MAQQPTGGMRPTPRGKADNDIFTALLVIAFAIVVGTIAFTLFRSSELLGTAIPGITG